MSLKRISALVATVLLLTTLGAHAAQNAKFPRRLALKIQMSGQQPLYVPLMAKPRTTLLSLSSGKHILLSFEPGSDARTVKVSFSAPVDRRWALEEGFEKANHTFTSYELALAPEAREVWVDDLSLFGIQPISMSVVDDPDSNPTIECTCGTETCYPKPGQCVDCGCAICCQSPKPGDEEAEIQ